MSDETTENQSQLIERLKNLKSTTNEEIDRLVKYAGTIPPLYRRGFVGAVEKSIPPRAAIKAMCQQCVGYEEVQEGVGGCTARKCPLWAYRPYQSTESEGSDE